jgi:hypothetical protein
MGDIDLERLVYDSVTVDYSALAGCWLGAGLAVQQGLGLRPQRRAWHGPTDLNHPLAVGNHLNSSVTP